MVESESVQYFQFNKYGNMYVYEPGSGFSGKAKLVEPGFEMEQVSDWGAVTSFVKLTFNDTIIASATSDVEISQMSQDISQMDLSASSKYAILLFSNILFSCEFIFIVENGFAMCTL